MSKRWTIACYWHQDVRLVPERNAWAIYDWRSRAVVRYVPDTGQDARDVLRAS